MTLFENGLALLFLSHVLRNFIEEIRPMDAMRIPKNS